MRKQYTRVEAEALIDRLLETNETLGKVPRGTRGRVIEALDAGDHWNLMIEWELPRISEQMWYDKYDVDRSMRLIKMDVDQSSTGVARDILVIRSSHDLAAMSADARGKGAHSYRLDCHQFTIEHRAWKNDKVQKSGPLGLTTLGLQRIWITEGESRRVAAAIQATHLMVALD